MSEALLENRITLRLIAGNWFATFSGPRRTEIVELFGTDTIPTVFTAKAPREDVSRGIMLRNPGFEVVFGAEGAIKQ